MRYIIKYKKFFLIFLSISMISCGIYMYTVNEGIYFLKRITFDNLDLINEYATYGAKFPDTTIIEEFELLNDYDSNFIKHGYIMNATLLVPNDELDKIFPQETREEREWCIREMCSKKSNGKVWFVVWLPRTVKKWFTGTQQDVDYTVMSPGEYNTRVYLSVDKVGWRWTYYTRIAVEEGHDMRE